MSTLNYNVFLDLQNRLESTHGHWHVFEIQPQRGGRITYTMDIAQDRPLRPFTVFQDVSGRRVIIPPGEYVSVTGGVEYISDPSAPVNVAVQTKNGRFYDGDHFGWEFALGVRLGARLISSVGWNRDDIKLPFGSFKNDLVPINVGVLVHEPRERAGTHPVRNRQTATISSNIRLALLNRSGTGLFAVYNDRRDTSDFTADTLLGRSFIVKYTRLVDFLTVTRAGVRRVGAGDRPSATHAARDARLRVRACLRQRPASVPGLCSPGRTGESRAARAAATGLCGCSRRMPGHEC